MEKTEKQDSVREAIRKAAEERFKRYGYNKTTMAEIAKDCGMTAGNLYRYFANKAEIIADLTESFFLTKEAMLEKILAAKGESAPERLRKMVHENLLFSYGVLSNQTHVQEMVDYVVSEHKAILDKHIAVITGIYARLIDEGVKEGAFVASNPSFTASSFMSATAKFSTPHFFRLCSLQELQEAAEGVLDLLFTGLLKRQQ